MIESDPRHPIRETVGRDRTYARVWRSVNAMSVERRSSFGVSVQMEGDRVLVDQGRERMTIEWIEGDRYQVEATSNGIAAMAIVTLI